MRTRSPPIENTRRTFRAVSFVLAFGSFLALTPAAHAGDEPIFPWDFDGGSYAGWSDVESPQVPKLGQLVISEVMANPAGTEADQEWFEMFNPTSFQLNLDGCAVDGGLQIATQSLVSPSQFAVVARNGNSGTNGGITPTAVAMFALANADSLTFACFGTSLDTVAWTSALDGQSWTLEPTEMTTVANDDPSNWCFDSTSAYGDKSAGTGTPGTVNSCP